MQIRLVTERDEVADALGELDRAVVGVDVERADGHHYVRPAVLVQVGCADVCVLLDVVALGTPVPSLEAFLRDRLAVFHAIENDLEPLDRLGVPLVTHDRERTAVADTATAAALLDRPTGLEPLLSDVLGVQLSGDKERLQRADWAARPLDDEMIAYAAGDVAHLPDLWPRLEAELREQGRFAWYEQELAATVDTARTRTRSWDRVRGAGRLDGRGRAVLRAVWEEREAIAREHDLAPQRVVRDEALVAIADDPPSTVNVLARRGVRRQQLRDHGQRLLAAVTRGRAAPDEPSPRGRRLSDEERGAVDRMRTARTRVAQEVGIDPGVLCPSRVLTDAVRAQPTSPDELAAAAGLRPWQRELLADVLWDVYRGSGAGSAPPAT